MLSVVRRTLLAAVAVTLSLAWCASPAAAVDGICVSGDCPPPGDGASGGAGGGSVAVTVWGSGVTTDGGSFEVPAHTRSVSSVCGYVYVATGAEYFQWWASGDAGFLLRHLPQEDRFEPWPGYADYRDDTEGAWWAPQCSSEFWVGDLDGFFAFTEAYFAAHDPVYVPAGAVPPESDVPPEVLAQIAYESMDLPQGVIRWNPSLDGGATVVNMDTWVWVEGAPTQVSVTAQVGTGTWARVDARLEGLELSAPGADPASCADTGVPWTADATGTSCSIVFFRSSANQPVKAGQVWPTATMTASAQWSASWVSSLDATPTALPTQEITTTAEVPVAEIQALVTLG